MLLLFCSRLKLPGDWALQDHHVHCYHVLGIKLLQLRLNILQCIL